MTYDDACFIAFLCAACAALLCIIGMVLTILDAKCVR